MDMGQLEEWCANELSGMSKARILSILNGKSMAESSDTSESDDSGMWEFTHDGNIIHYVFHIHFHGNRALVGNYLGHRGMV